MLVFNILRFALSFLENLSYISFFLFFPDINPFSTSLPQQVETGIGHAAIIPVPPISSIPYADISWLNGTTKMSSEGRRYDYTSNQSLVLLDVTPNDNGTTFTAVADNSLNPKVRSNPFTIIVTGKHFHVLFLVIAWTPM